MSDLVPDTHVTGSLTFLRPHSQGAGNAKPLLLSAGESHSAFPQPVLDLVPDGCGPQGLFQPMSPVPSPSTARRFTTPGLPRQEEGGLIRNPRRLLHIVRDHDNGVLFPQFQCQEALCMRLLLQQQPVAGDLRAVSSALKIICDMERIGDQAADIAEITRHTGSHSTVPLYAYYTTLQRRFPPFSAWMVLCGMRPADGKGSDDLRRCGGPAL